MKTAMMAFAALLCLVPAKARSETIVYRIIMSLNVPRVYDNMKSLGYRRNQLQKITGYVTVDKELHENEYEPRIEASCFYNKTHKIGGKYVTYYDSVASDVMWRYIGSNRTGLFKNAQIKFNIDLNPSYNIGDDEPDNTLIVQLSGRGATENRIKGSVTGQIGCGCLAYGHVSPTRTVDGRISDITPLYGTFSMTRIAVIGSRYHSIGFIK